MLPEKLVKLLEEELPRYSHKIDRENLVPAELIKSLKHAGFFSIAIPEEYGGLGLGVKGVVELAIKASEESIAIASIGIIHAGVAIAVERYGSTALKEEVLPKMAEGRSIAAVSITEPGGGSDLAASLKTSSNLSSQGWIINGEKIFTSNGLYADLFLVLARSGFSEKSFNLILVPKSDRVKVEVLELTAFRGAGIARVGFHEAIAPKHWILGEAGKGFRLALETINYGRLAYAAMGIGAVRGLLKSTLSYASSRMLFGQKLIDFQGPRWMLADLYSRATILEQALKTVAEKAEKEGRLDPLLASMLKVESSKLAMEAAAIALRLHGGRGLSLGSLTERMLRDSTALAIGEGANEVLLDYISRMMAKKLLKE